jgi:hypothetical protein
VGPATQIRPFVDFQSSFGTGGFEVNTGGDPIVLDFDRSVIGVEVGHAMISIGDFFYIEGGFAIEKGSSVNVDIVTGFTNTSAQAATILTPLVTQGYVTPLQYSRINNLPMDYYTIGLSDVNFFAGSGPYFVDSDEDGDIDADDERSEDAVGLVIENLDLALAFFRSDALKSLGVTNLWALSASADEVAFTGIDFLTI